METTAKGDVLAPVRRLELRPLEHFTERAVAGLIGVAAAGTGFAVLLLLIRLNWEPMERVDHGAAAGLNSLVAGDRPLVTLLRAITTMGGHTILWWLVTVGAIGLVLRRQAQLAAYLVVTGLGALALDPILKLVVGRLRPVVAHPVATGQGNSFPSGHALGSIVAYGALLLVFLPAVPRRARLATTVGTGALVVAIGFTRIALGVHYVSDVLGGWMLGVAWLGVTAYTFRLWRRETGQREPDLSAGLAPEAAPALVPARREHPRHPWRAVAELLVAAVLVLGAVFGLGVLVTRYPPGFDEAVPTWFALHRTPGLTPLSYFWSQAGNTHAILAVGLVAGPLALMAIRRWRPVVYLVVTMFGELGLFLATANILDRSRPPVSQMDGHLPTSSFPSGHVAATVCLYGAIAVLVMPRTRHRWRWLTVGLAVFMPVMVILARLYRGEHHPTDIAGGVLLALFWLAAVTYVVRPNADLDGRPRAGHRPGRSGESRPGDEARPSPVVQEGRRAAAVPGRARPDA